MFGDNVRIKLVVLTVVSLVSLTGISGPYKSVMPEPFLQTSSPQLYFTTGTQISNLNLADGTLQSLEVPIVTDADAIIVNEDQDLIIWCSCGFPSLGKIFSSTLDGTNFRTIVSTPLQDVDSFLFPKPILDVAYDPISQQVYWIEQNAEHQNFTGTEIKRVTLDGSHVEQILPEINTFRSLDLDTSERRIYWAEDPRGIFSASLEGDDVKQVSQQSAQGIEFDQTHQYIYFESRNQIYRMDSDGTNVQFLRSQESSIDFLLYFSIDETRQVLYRNSRDRILRTDLTDLDLEDEIFIENARNALGIVANDQSGTLYVAYPAEIQSFSEQAEYLDQIVLGIESIRAFAISKGQEDVYYITANKLFSYSVKSGHITLLVPDSGDALDLVLDDSSDFIYWSRASSGIYRYSLESRTVELIVELDPRTQANGIVIDQQNSKLFWIDDESIHRSNLDGTDQELVISNTVSGRKIAIDHEESKVYWTESGGLKRANADGTKIDNVYIATGPSVDIIFDDVGRQIYWTLPNDRLILKSNPDGSDVEEIFDEASVTSLVIVQ